MHTATQILRDEHETILSMLDATEEVARSLEAGTAVPAQTLNDIIEFLRLFADRCHHGKEEDLLFPLLQQKGMPVDGGPVAVMLMEHDEGRGFIREMDEAAKQYQNGEKDAGTQWAEAAGNYVGLLREHIGKENNILFVMADQLLSPSEQQDLVAAFTKVESEKMGAGTHERLHRIKDAVLAQAAAQFND
jgi:hemerythrin-like domain-containing protein